MSDEAPGTVPEALEDGYRPEAHGETPEDAEWREYAWGFIPCPHCDTGMLVGVHDPDHEIGAPNGTPMAIMAPGGDDD